MAALIVDEVVGCLRLVDIEVFRDSITTEGEKFTDTQQDCSDVRSTTTTTKAIEN